MQINESLKKQRNVRKKEIGEDSEDDLDVDINIDYDELKAEISQLLKENAELEKQITSEHD